MFPIFYGIILCLLGVSICYVQVSAMVHEKEGERLNLDGKCVQFQKILELGIKCSMAFLFGGIMSEFRFIKFGHM
jgi:hypothetical protein